MAIDENIIYRELGKSIVIFQYIESIIKEIVHFVIDPDRKESSRVLLESYSFARLRDTSEVVLAEVLKEQKIVGSEILIERYHDLMTQVRVIGSVRNKLVHSVYLHLEAGNELIKIVRSSSSIKTSGNDGPHRN